MIIKDNLPKKYTDDYQQILSEYDKNPPEKLYPPSTNATTPKELIKNKIECLKKGETVDYQNYYKRNMATVDKMFNFLVKNVYTVLNVGNTAGSDEWEFIHCICQYDALASDILRLSSKLDNNKKLLNTTLSVEELSERLEKLYEKIFHNIPKMVFNDPIFDTYNKETGNSL